jgi:hypothetical protein
VLLLWQAGVVLDVRVMDVGVDTGMMAVAGEVDQGDFVKGNEVGR